MNPATHARPRTEPRALLVVTPEQRHVAVRTLEDLPDLLRAGDLVVVNDAATLPASLTTVDGSVELRLCARLRDGAFRALVFGAGTWRMRTEDRPVPPPLREGTRLVFAGGLAARVAAVESARLVRVRFLSDDSALWPALYRSGRPVQYAYLERALDLWDVQSVFASRPWAFEPASAGLPLSFDLLTRLRQNGIALASLTHAAGLSSTGDAALDATLPWEERYDLPSATVEAIARAKRVIAVGTTVVRALEGAYAANGALVAGEGTTNLRIGPGFVPQVVDGLLTGVHDPSESHFALLSAFVSRTLLEQAHAIATSAGLLGHEFGDSTLVLPAP